MLCRCEGVSFQTARARGGLLSWGRVLGGCCSTLWNMSCSPRPCKVLSRCCFLKAPFSTAANSGGVQISSTSICCQMSKGSSSPEQAGRQQEDGRVTPWTQFQCSVASVAQGDLLLYAAAKNRQNAGVVCEYFRVAGQALEAGEDEKSVRCKMSLEEEPACNCEIDRAIQAI